MKNARRRIWSLNIGRAKLTRSKNGTDTGQRYIISMATADMSDQAWLQGFNETGAILLGMTANELAALRVRTP